MPEPIGESWKSVNAANAIKQHMLPMVCFNSDHIKAFLTEYQSAYPDKIAELSLLSKLSPEDWKAVAKQYKCTEWHHYGQAIQRVGFWDMWAVAEVVLSICRTASGNYSVQLFRDQQQQYYKQYRTQVNKDNSNQIVRLVMFRYASDVGELYAPGLLKESYRGKKNTLRFAEIFYMDYLLSGEFHNDNKINYISAQDTATKGRFSITTTIMQVSADSISKFSRFKLCSFRKLQKYAEQQHWKISETPTKIKQKLAYVGPPESYIKKNLV